MLQLIMWVTHWGLSFQGGSQSGDLSETISCSVKKVLLEPVEFTHAQKPAALHVENLRNKYISLNPGAHGAGATNGHNSTGEGEASSNGVRGSYSISDSEALIAGVCVSFGRHVLHASRKNVDPLVWIRRTFVPQF